jgi:hypothetical protein
MESKGTSSAGKSFLELAYAPPVSKRQTNRTETFPGPLFDVTVFGLCLILGIAYFL